MRKIIHVPHEVLTTPSKSVDTIDHAVVDLVKEMEKILAAQVDPQGVGLAAPQIGVGLRIFIAKPSKNKRAEAYINPKILESIPLPDETTDDKKRKSHRLEGCLSIPFIWSPVKRPSAVKVEYQDLNRKKHTKWMKGFMAVIFQHEVDHLMGILFTQRALEQKATLYEEKNGKLEKMDY